MGDRRLLFAPISGVIVLALFSGSAAAVGHSTSQVIIQRLGNQLLAVAVAVTLITEFFLFYAIWKFSRADEPKPTQQNRRLEITWTIATAIILLFVGVSAYTVMANPAVTPTRSSVNQEMQHGDPVVVDVVGAQWYWTFSYPGHNITTQNTLVLPANRQVVMKITSKDVNHAVWIPQLGLKKDAIPGQTNYLMTKLSPDSAGHTYDLYCAEYCGSGHSQMRANVRVLPPKQYHKWLSNHESANGS